MVLEHYKTELELAQYVSKLEAQVKGYKALCERLQAQADEMRSACQWISVENRLPVPNTKVLAHSKRCQHFFAIRKNRQSAPWEFLDGDTCHEKITHWMPLPAAPTPTNGVSHD